MARCESMKGLCGLLPTPYREDLEIDTDDLRSVANYCCETLSLIHISEPTRRTPI